MMNVALPTVEDGEAAAIATRDSSRLVPVGVDGLAKITFSDADLVAGAVDASRLSCWAAYFPHLLFTSRSARRILHEMVDGSLLLYLLRNDRGRPELSLLFPPLPFNTTALRHAGGRMEAINHGQVRSIEWIGEDMLLDVVRQGYAGRVRASEYVLDQASVAAAEGPAFSRLRKTGLAKANRLPGLVLRAYLPEDLAPCLDVLKQWRDRQTANDIVPNGYRYTRRCLERAPKFPTNLLRGEVAEVDGKISGFAFGGPINREWGSMFITITDVAYAGLPYLLRHRMIAAFPELRFFNDLTDNGRVALAELKRSFRPVEMAKSYRGKA